MNRLVTAVIAIAFTIGARQEAIALPHDAKPAQEQETTASLILKLRKESAINYLGYSFDRLEMLLSPESFTSKEPTFSQNTQDLTKETIRRMQSNLNNFNKREGREDNIIVDGKLGKTTAIAIARFAAKHVPEFFALNAEKSNRSMLVFKYKHIHKKLEEILQTKGSKVEQKAYKEHIENGVKGQFLNLERERVELKEKLQASRDVINKAFKICLMVEHLKLTNEDVTQMYQKFLDNKRFASKEMIPSKCLSLFESALPEQQQKLLSILGGEFHYTPFKEEKEHRLLENLRKKLEKEGYKVQPPKTPPSTEEDEAPDDLWIDENKNLTL